MIRQNVEAYRHAMELLLEQPELAHFCEEQADNHEPVAEALEHELERHGQSAFAHAAEVPPALKAGVNPHPTPTPERA
ncbi:MAG: hypothetical protein ACREQE_02955 [Candidatus Binataceae bacterium]